MESKPAYFVGQEAKMPQAVAKVTIVLDQTLDAAVSLMLPGMPAGKQVAETLTVVDRETQEAAAKREVVAGEEAAASTKAAAAKAIKVGPVALLYQFLLMPSRTPPRVGATAGI
jgi:hypothetical protein